MAIVVSATFKMSATLETTENELKAILEPDSSGFNCITRIRDIQWRCKSKYHAKKLVKAIMHHSPTSLNFEVES